MHNYGEWKEYNYKEINMVLTERKKLEEVLEGWRFTDKTMKYW